MLSCRHPSHSDPPIKRLPYPKFGYANAAIRDTPPACSLRLATVAGWSMLDRRDGYSLEALKKA